MGIHKQASRNSKATIEIPQNKTGKFLYTQSAKKLNPKIIPIAKQKHIGARTVAPITHLIFFMIYSPHL